MILLVSWRRNNIRILLSFLPTHPPCFLPVFCSHFFHSTIISTTSRSRSRSTVRRDDVFARFDSSSLTVKLGLVKLGLKVGLLASKLTLEVDARGRPLGPLRPW